MNKKNILYIAFLRGINVGGHNVKMDHLKELFRELGLQNVRSYIQSGNIFFESDITNEEKLRKMIEEHLEKKLGYKVPVCLRTIEELEKILALNPFKHITLTPTDRFAVTFFAEPVTTKLELPYLTSDGGYEVIKQTSREFFVVWHLINGRPGNSYGALEKQMKVTATTRFWRTTEKIVQAAKH